MELVFRQPSAAVSRCCVTGLVALEKKAYPVGISQWLKPLFSPGWNARTEVLAYLSGKGNCSVLNRSEPNPSAIAVGFKPIGVREDVPWMF